MTTSTTEEHILQYRKAFAICQKEEDGKIYLEDLGVVMRSMGQNPTEAELQEMINEADIDNKGSIEFHEFLNMMERKIDYIDSEDEVIDAFRVFDQDGSGLVSAAELREVLTSLGEKLTEEEVEELFSEAEIDENGLFNYQDICQAIIQ